MLELNIDFSLLNNYFGISESKVQSEYANKDLEEIMELEAQSGNEKAKNYESILTNPDKLSELFNLCSTENKLIILQNLSEGDLDKLLPYLTNDQLSQGLYFFENEKIISMAQELPIEELSGMIFDNFQVSNVLDYMDENALNNFLNEDDIERSNIQKYYESLDGTALKNIMEQTMGTSYEDKSQDEIIKELQEMGDIDFQNLALSIEREDKINLITNLTSQDEKFLLLFEPSDLTKPMETIAKGAKIDMLKKLDPEYLVSMTQELPMDLTQITLTQIRPQDFAQVLVKDFKEVLKSAVIFSSK